jgi:hypothetical protein
MLPSEQNAQCKGCKSIRRDEAAHFRSQKPVVAAVANYQQQFRDRELYQYNAKDEKDPRILIKAFGLINPQLCNGGR